MGFIAWMALAKFLPMIMQGMQGNKKKKEEDGIDVIKQSAMKDAKDTAAAGVEAGAADAMKQESLDRLLAGGAEGGGGSGETPAGSGGDAMGMIASLMGAMGNNKKEDSSADPFTVSHDSGSKGGMGMSDLFRLIGQKSFTSQVDPYAPTIAAGGGAVSGKNFLLPAKTSKRRDMLTGRQAQNDMMRAMAVMGSMMGKGRGGTSGGGSPPMGTSTMFNDEMTSGGSMMSGTGEVGDAAATMFEDELLFNMFGGR